jgi:nitrogen fixation/metabolism regulation signal transduction histidine kinase
MVSGAKAMIHRLDLKIMFALVATVLMPLGFSVFLVTKVISTSLGLGLNEQTAAQLEQALESRRRYIGELKRGMRQHFDYLADSRRLANSIASGEDAKIRATLNHILSEEPMLRQIRILGPEKPTIKAMAVVDSDSDKQRTMSLEQDIDNGPYNRIEALYAVDASLLKEYEEAGEAFATYQALVEAPPNYIGNRFILAYITILGLTVFLSITIGILWARRLARRIHSLARATQLVAEGDLSVRVDSGSADEVGRLVNSFNGMVAELAVSRTRIEYLQKISAWQEMARRLAHEIKNPLTPIQLAAQQLKNKYDGKDPSFARLLDQSTEIIAEEVNTLRRLVSDFSSFAKLPEVKTEQVNLSDFMKECEASLASVAQQEGVSLVFDALSEPIQIQIDRIMMKRVIDNLVRNAAEALIGNSAPNPRVSVRAAMRKAKKNNEVEIRIEDNGPGILPEHHPSIFEPYFTTKSEGTGLGLAIVKKIVLEHDGRIWLDENPDSGAAFVIILPASNNKKTKQ